jgi:hypothetical protein
MARSRKRSSDLGLFSDRFIVRVPRQRPRRRKKSEAQVENANHFRQATDYAKRCMEIPELKAKYEKGITRRKNNAYTVACSDYLNPPTIHYIKAMESSPTESIITIKATDDFEVVSVRITIISPDGKVMEEGSAVCNRLKRQMWTYATQSVSRESKGVQIRAIAEDHAGNLTERQLVLLGE